jgi:hypothetical protein
MADLEDPSEVLMDEIEKPLKAIEKKMKKLSLGTQPPQKF